MVPPCFSLTFFIRILFLFWSIVVKILFGHLRKNFPPKKRRSFWRVSNSKTVPVKWNNNKSFWDSNSVYLLFFLQEIHIHALKIAISRIDDDDDVFNVRVFSVGRTKISLIYAKNRYITMQESLITRNLEIMLSLLITQRVLMTLKWRSQLKCLDITI